MRHFLPEAARAALQQFISPLEIAPFDDVAAAYGDIRRGLEKASTQIGALETLIGAHALSLGLMLITHNTREFSRIAGLRLADWAAK